MPIHPTAVIDPRAQIDSTVSIGPYCVVEGDVVIGPGTVLGTHVHLLGHTRIGSDCRIHSHAVLGDTPQDRAFTGGESYCEIGSGCIIREHVTVHRGTQPGTTTRIGERCMLMASSHVGHNCQVGNDVILVNSCLLGGYVSVGDRALLSGNVGVHQFVRIGTLAMIGGLAKITQDVLPFFMVDGPGYCVGVNRVGMKRAGFTPAERADALHAFRTMCRTPGTVSSCLERLRGSVTTRVGQEVLAFLDQKSKRGFHLKTGDAVDEGDTEV